MEGVDGSRLGFRSRWLRRHRPFAQRGEGLQPFLNPLGVADFLQHGLVPGAQGCDVMLKRCEFGLVGLVELVVGSLELF